MGRLFSCWYEHCQILDSNCQNQRATLGLVSVKKKLRRVEERVIVIRNRAKWPYNRPKLSIGTINSRKTTLNVAHSHFEGWWYLGIKSQPLAFVVP